MDPRIKLRHIQGFVEIARSGSLKSAAGTLNLTQPAMSKTLRELEGIVGSSLMRRSRAGISLTAEGEVFDHFAQMALAALRQGLDGIEQVGAEAAGRLTVGALPSVAAALMPRAVAEFGALAPGAVLRIFDGPHAYLIERLRLGTLDLVVGRLGEPDTMQGISFTQLYTEEVAFVVRAGHPLLGAPDLRALPDWPVLYPPPGAAIRPLVERLLIATGVGPLPNRIETVSGGFGRAYTRGSDAVWIISGGVVAREVADGTLMRLPFETALTAGPVGLMTRPDLPASPLHRMFERAVARAVDGGAT